MHIHQAIELLEESTEFTSWKKDHKDSYLVHSFKMFDEVNKNIWQIGYFNPGSHLITVFVVGEEIHRNPDAQVFKEQEKLVNPLNIELVKINEEEAMTIANDVLKENYRAQIFKSFLILQNLEEHGQVWNVTFVTQQFKTINVKIDANAGTVVVHKEISLISKE
jgi:hypothetical protein